MSVNLSVYCTSISSVYDRNFCFMYFAISYLVFLGTFMIPHNQGNFKMILCSSGCVVKACLCVAVVNTQIFGKREEKKRNDFRNE